MSRRLADKLFLVVQGSDGKWQLPSAPVTGDDDLRAAAERALATVVDTAATQTYFVGNAPSHCYAEGDRKVFALRTVLVAREPVMQAKSPYKAHRWLTRDEIASSPDMPSHLARFMF